MPSDRSSTPPPSGGGEVAPEDHSDAAMRILLDTPKETLARALRLLGQIDTERERDNEALRHLTAAVERLEAGHDRIEAALLIVDARVAKLDERTRVSAELVNAGFRDRDGDISALQHQFDHVNEQHLSRAREHGTRLGLIEEKMPAWQAAVRELRQRKLATPLASMLGGGGILGLVELAKLIAHYF